MCCLHRLTASCRKTCMCKLCSSAAQLLCCVFVSCGFARAMPPKTEYQVYQANQVGAASKPSITRITFLADRYDGFRAVVQREYGGVWDPRMDDYAFRCHFDGIFFIDGFVLVMGKHSRETYVAEILFNVKMRTGMKCAAMVLPSACFVNDSYIRMLHIARQSFRKPVFMVWMSQGKDLYPLEQNLSKLSLLYERTSSLLQEAAVWVPEQRLVFGCDSDIWRLNGLENDCSEYDVSCKKLTQYLCRACGLSCITGRYIFDGIAVTGPYVSVESMPILVDAFEILTRWGMAQSPRLWPWYEWVRAKL